MPPPLVFTALSNQLLGPPGRQRLRVAQTLLMVIGFGAMAVLMLFQVRLGQMASSSAAWITAVWMTGGLLFYFVVRSGLNQRFTADPSLTEAQVVFAIAGQVLIYSVYGSMRGVVLAFCVLVLVFTMFGLKPRNSRRLILLTFCMFVAVMVWKSQVDPEGYPPAIELVHGASLAILLGSVTVLTGRMGEMRAQMKSQKHALVCALEEVSRLATHDELTGLVNRRRMNALLQAEQARQSHSAAPMCVALLDIDLFKRINDGHGHQAGDTVLKTFADASRQVLRAGDVLARWGGEEFLLMLPDTPPEHAAATLERLRKHLAQISFDAIAADLKVTFSAGLSHCGEDEALDACIERADQAMYRAKTQGRDCTVMA